MHRNVDRTVPCAAHDRITTILQGPATHDQGLVSLLKNSFTTISPPPSATFA